MTDEMQVKVSENGPYLVSGGVPIARQTIVPDAKGQSAEWREGEGLPAGEAYALCRCGHSRNKPFCDGTHLKIGFVGPETAPHTPYVEMATEQDGPELALTDAESLCAFARFCDADGQVWNLVEMPGHAEDVKREAGQCPSGRLIAWDLQQGAPLEPDLPKSIGIVEDPGEGVSGPIWVRGGIRVTSADGVDYEIRNRVTLCRCGASRNKPFCDGSHAQVGFDDGHVTSD